MAAGSSATILLKTKLHTPPLQADLVVRERLLRKLRQGLGGKLTLVAAPAGFGKSTLAASWLSQLAGEAAAGEHGWGRHGWLSLDSHDDNLARFLTYVVAAVRTVYADACPLLEQVFQRHPLPPVAYLAELLVSELAELPGNLIFVLDDFHQVQNLDVQEVVEALLAHAPHNLHLVIISRLDPPLPLSRLRVQKQISEVRAADLRFSVAEAGIFFERALGTLLPADAVRLLDERAEGWIAGLRLAALSLQEGADPAGLSAAFRGTQHHVLDFLLEQVMAQQPPAVTTFLACTAPLEMLCAPLCSEVLAAVPVDLEGTPSRFVSLGRGEEEARIDSRAVLNYLDRSNLFVVALDDSHQWHRYHHLFREMLLYWLRTHYSADEIAAINRRAAAWYARNGYIEAAVQQLMAAGATTEAADLIETSIPPSLGREAWQTVQSLLASLPEATVMQRPVLILARAWLMSLLQRFDLLAGLLEKAERLLDQEEAEHGRPRPTWLLGWIDALWSLVCFVEWDLAPALARAHSALASVPAGHGYVRGMTTVYYLMSLQSAGRRDEALAYCAHALANEPEEVRQRVEMAPGALAMLRADLTGLAAAGESALRAGPQTDVCKLWAWGHLYLGVACYEQNNLAAAQEHFLAAYEDRLGASAGLGFGAACGMALVQQALGDSGSAAEWTATVTRLAGEAQDAYLAAAGAWFHCRMALQSGGTPAPPSGHQWCVGHAPALQYRWTELPDLTYARLLVAQAGRAGLVEAVALLQRLEQQCRNVSLRWRQIETTALLALAYQAQGQEPLAQETAEAALALTGGQPFVRTFVNLGPPMAALLYALARKGVAAEQIGRLLTSFPLESRNAVAVAAGRLDDEVIEPLSERELEVLGLLAERLSDKEIAQQLRISPLTVRRHSVNLYQKLHVNSRRQAVSRAQALGLLRAPV